MMKKLLFILISVLLLSGCSDGLKPGDVITDVEKYCYSEKEIWEEFARRGFDEERLTVMNFFGEQKEPSIWYNYDLDFDFNWDSKADKTSDEKHPDYHFLYITGDFAGYDTSSQELITPKLYDGDTMQFWSIQIIGDSWYAGSMTNAFYNQEGDGLAIEKSARFMIGENNFTVIDAKQLSSGSEKAILVNKITHDKLNELAKNEFKVIIEENDEGN